MNAVSSRLVKGIVPPLVTPLASFDALDQPGLEALVERLIGARVNALFILGTTGEGPALSQKLRMEVVERVCACARGRVPILVAITDTSFAESLRLAEYSAKAGATAVVAAPPFYFRYGQGELLRYVERLASESPLPLFLYNQPALTKISFEPNTVARAAEMPQIVGVKDSSGQIGYIKSVLSLISERRPDFCVLVGPEHLLAEALLVGAHGGVPGGANIFPHLAVRLFDLFLQGQISEMMKVQQEIISIGSAIWKRTGEDGSSYLRRLKCALSVLGICNGAPAFPYTEPDPAERLEIEAHLRQHNIVPG
jgi:dihydrodipicolinate synthase/N-acetylneuraminate lyase